MKPNKHQINSALKFAKNNNKGFKIFKEHNGFIVMGSSMDVIKTKINAIDRGDTKGHLTVFGLVKKRLEEINKEQDKIENLIDEKDKKWDINKPFNEYWEYMRPEKEKLSNLCGESRMISPIEVDDISTHGDVMSLKDFEDNVACGGFIDYDGFGRYIVDGKETNIEIYPSDFKRGLIREEFDTIIWFNR
jgi:hypothetical protein